MKILIINKFVLGETWGTGNIIILPTGDNVMINVPMKNCLSSEK